MNKKYSIGFLVGFIILVALFVYAYRISHNRAMEKHQTQPDNTVAETELCYYIKSLDGYVTVFKWDNQTVYEYTSIVVEDLPKSIQENLINGIKLTSLGQVYAFLENYSS